MRKHRPLASLILFCSSSIRRLKPPFVLVDASSNALDLDCMCNAYDVSSERNGSPVDSTGSSCTDGFLAMVATYAPDYSSGGGGGTCEEMLKNLPSNSFCGFPNDDSDSGSSVCSSTASGRGECEFELFAATIPCEWSHRRACSWHEGVCSDSVSDWFRVAYGISSTDCSSQKDESSCIGTDVLDGHCVSFGFDGEDVDFVCPSRKDRSSCEVASYVADRPCEWHEAIVRDTTFFDCCDVPYQTPYAGSRWCAPIGMSYVPDGRVSSGIVRAAPSDYYTCDDIAGTYVYGIHSREVLRSEYGHTGLIDEVDANCCVPHPPTAEPTFAPSTSPSETTRPSTDPTVAPSLSLRPTYAPSAPPTTSTAPTAAASTVSPSGATPESFPPGGGSEPIIAQISNQDVDGAGAGGAKKTAGFVLVMAGCPALLVMFGCWRYHKAKDRHEELQARRAVTDNDLSDYNGV